MPHFTVEHSANVEEWIDLKEFCDVLRKAAIDTGVFPMPGVRVRAVRCDNYSIADGGYEHGFLDIVARIREGRPFKVREKAVNEIFKIVEEYMEPCLKNHSFSLSMEMNHINDSLSPKKSSIREYLARKNHE